MSKSPPPTPETLEPSREEDEEDRRSGVSRLVAFSDGVFAFAMTLLIINILPYANLGKRLSEASILHMLLPPSTFLTSVLSFALSFYIIGLTWQSHRWLFRYVVKLDATMFFLDLTLLLCIAFLPFPTDLLGQYLSPLTAALFGGTLAILRLLQVLMWWNASSHHRLIRPALPQRTIEFVGWRIFLPLPIYVLSIGLAFINPLLAIAAWLSTILLNRIMDRRYGVQEW
ncbi:MAG: TMEM175 family protein [Ktedonobacterales bacterium]